MQTLTRVDMIVIGDNYHVTKLIHQKAIESYTHATLYVVQRVHPLCNKQSFKTHKGLQEVFIETLYE
jgi:hypothetical protein